MTRSHPLPRETVLSLLAEQPARIAALTAGLEPARLLLPPVPGEWSVNEVLAHLRSCADVWGDCIRAMLADNRPTLKAIDPRTWIKSTDYPDLGFQPSLQAFTTQRAELLAMLEALAPGDWQRAATVTGAGKPLERTVHAYASRLARHERTHVKQIAKTAEAVRNRAM